MFAQQQEEKSPVTPSSTDGSVDGLDEDGNAVIYDSDDGVDIDVDDDWGC
jgi:hypothetical protein